MAEQFKFPDEDDSFNKPEAEEQLAVTAEGDEEAEIIIEDDTPERDRKAQPLNREVEDPSEEEIEGYTKGVQGRIKELTHARHDERRAKEAALREREEAVRLAQQILEVRVVGKREHLVDRVRAPALHRPASCERSVHLLPVCVREA